ncbi:MAG TPA: hypothetical protein VEK07_01225, partial [Polyangiaceae bacterium]|nr:hypothetical protein [Polyangiaceae bacterium]
MALHRSFRAVLFAALTVALWTLARPASASDAPFCDDRGASAIAAPPALDASDVAVARARACPSGGDDTSYLAAVGRARGRLPWSVQGADATAVQPRALEWAAASCRESRDIRCITGRSAGVRSRIDRPP